MDDALIPSDHMNDQEMLLKPVTDDKLDAAWKTSWNERADMQLPSRLVPIVALIAVVLVLTACASGRGDPADAVERYLEAMVEKDVAQLVSASCAAWEEEAQVEVDSFLAVDVALQDASCSTIEETGDTASVTCTGAIVATYNNEDQELTLEGRTYQVVFESGEWRMCGYQ